MYTLFYVITILVSLVLGLYFILHFRSLPLIACFQKQKLVPWALSILLTVLIFIKASNIFSLSFAMVFLLFQIYLLTDLIGFVIHKFVKKPEIIAKWKKIYCGGLLAFLFAGIYLLAGYWNAVHVSFTNYEITTNKLGQEERLKIAMIADLHLGTTMGVEELAKYCDNISKEQPDVVLLVGDIFDERSPEEGIQKTCELFGKIKSTYGTYYVYGNHDLGSYRRTYSLSKVQLQTYFKQADVKVLDDEAVLINDSFYLIGRSALSFSGNNNRASIERLIHDLDQEKFMILLDHQPKELTIAAKLGIDLLVSGHTHGGQLWPVGVFARLFQIDELTYGENVIDNFHAIVTSGIAGWGYAVKTGAKSEIVIIDVMGRK